MFEPYLKGFFVHSGDPTHIRLLKVNILVTTCKDKLLVINYRPFSKILTWVQGLGKQNKRNLLFYSPKPRNQVEI